MFMIWRLNIVWWSRIFNSYKWNTGITIKILQQYNLMQYLVCCVEYLNHRDQVRSCDLILLVCFMFQVKWNCVLTSFLKNLGSQIAPNILPASFYWIMEYMLWKSKNDIWELICLNMFEQHSQNWKEPVPFRWEIFPKDSTTNDGSWL